ncbi:hypothetical protein TUMEXPCC7403_18905 [Tumidithrix helvetica PCC 7403]|uniref:SdpI family protein n=1 Tax=Tumidithrix helvetica TaxID=3457545 RepID=UPI003C9BBED0
MDDFFLINSLFLGVGLLYVGLSLPLIAEKIKPNNWYGFRTAKTLSSPRIWYPANKAMGYDLLIAGSVVSVTALVILTTGRSLGLVPAGIINGVVLLLTLAVAVLHSFSVLRRL